MSPDIDAIADDVEMGMDYGMAWLKEQWYYHLLAGGAEALVVAAGIWAFLALGGVGVAGVVGLTAALVAGYSLLRRLLWVIVA